MRKYALPVMLALTGTLTLGACSQQNEGAQSEQSAAVPANTGSRADCAQLVSELTALSPATPASTEMTAATLKPGQGQSEPAKPSSAAGDEAAAEAEGPQLSAEGRAAQTACYSYLQGLVTSNLKGMTANQPYAYLVPAGNDDANVAQRQRQLDNVSDVVARGVTPGNLLALAGPDSSQTAALTIAAFQGASPKSLKGTIVMFVGDQADEQRVQAAVDPSGATFRFVAM